MLSNCHGCGEELTDRDVIALLSFHDGCRENCLKEERHWAVVAASAPPELLPISKEELLYHLRALVAGVEHGDTLEGNIAFLLNHEGNGGDGDPALPFLVEGAYRIGNIDGQGGVRMLRQSKPRGDHGTV
jgi:hypothetical protein